MLNNLILYRDMDENNILRDFLNLLNSETEQPEIFFDLYSRLMDVTVSRGFSGNLFRIFIAYLLANHENPFSLSCEKKGATDNSLSDIALFDIKIIRRIFNLNIEALKKKYPGDLVDNILDYKPAKKRSVIFNESIRDSILKLSNDLAAADDDAAFFSHISDFYRDFGVGEIGLHKAFRIDISDNITKIVPITNIPMVKLEDLVGYEDQKKKLTDNTESFLNGLPANNCLLFGDAGTGKSSSIKAIVNRYYDKGLRIIEVYKHQFKYLFDVISIIKSRNYRFIIYMDDLSFEEYETEYKYLKAVIEGGLEDNPDNILIYATSNRRHLIRERFSDKSDVDDELHTNDTVQEKLSLAARFGVTIYFPSPEKKEFEEIVLALADRNGLEIEKEELLAESRKWALHHGHISGRMAHQFIDYINAKLKS